MNSNRFPTNNFLAAAIIGAVIATALAGCASGASESAGSASAPPPAATAASDPPTHDQKSILGMWEGTTLASCGITTIRSRCNAEQNVSITLVQAKNSKIGGFYTCAYGNLNCYNMNTTGNVAYAKVIGNQISIMVMMPDGTACRFNGRNDNGNVIGGYECSAGGGTFEQGAWRSRHSY